MGPALFAAIWTVYFFSYWNESSASGVFELRIESFHNDLGLTSNGTCCSGYRKNGVCSLQCRTYFKVCLTHYQSNIAALTNPKCTFANYSTPVVGNNSMDFTTAATSSTFRYPVTEFAWPGDFSLIIEAWHEADSSRSENGSTLIARLAGIKSLVSGQQWLDSAETINTTEIRYGLRFQCQANYYGAMCADFCRARNDQFGHYTCSQNGTKICTDGWDGEYCETAICLPGCHPDNGYCDHPNECSCRLGWQGQYCNSCIPYPGCQRGSCDKPWQCNCDEGWGGLFCNQDLNFCTHHKPCKNGGVCTNTGAGSYTCSCNASYTGVNCEREIDDCQNKPCLNRGLCLDIGTGFQCQCPQGFYGRQCEKQAVSCKAGPCVNGGTCLEGAGSYTCLCPPGYSGPNCQVDVDDCISAPCLNGGRCSDQPNGYKCFCPAGYNGTECQTNIDDCKLKPCLNQGTCVDLVSDFRCQCVPGFVGSLCQINVDDCEMRPCANGGVCTDLINDFQCQCAAGFDGKDCSLVLDACASKPCLNGGACTNLFADFSCSCPEGYWGKSCQLLLGMAPNQTVESSTTAATGQMSANSAQEEVGLTLAQLLIVVCLGGGIPLLIIIIAVSILLCRKRSYLQRHTQQNLENLAREKEHHYINNMNNKCSADSTLPSTLPSSSSNSSSIKICNEDQQDLNKLKSSNLLPEHTGGGACSKQQSGPAVCGSTMCGSAMCGSAMCGSAMCGSAMCKGDIRDYRRLNVDSLPSIYADIKTGASLTKEHTSMCEGQHTEHMTWRPHSEQAPGYLPPTVLLHHYSCHDEDYLATEV
ncbi:delta-like protein 1 [Physella acuta]|uniref:delta-like protein 1 n=1 Tax=Physella acuta TaxID=109671 RepID=UPI0027DDD166|nr:delta-like protein 1 [Physella acuta]